IFEDQEGKMNRSLLDIQGGLLLVSQFTLYANTQKGRRPSFTEAMPPAEAKRLFAELVESAKTLFDIDVQTGQFGAEMHIQLCNEGPVTLHLES
ncbi:MAG: D-aminoacyl-tRNA deacylase, partial [Myxococcota bacterium]